VLEFDSSSDLIDTLKEYYVRYMFLCRSYCLTVSTALNKGTCQFPRRLSSTFLVRVDKVLLACKVVTPR
jgi:hypothetical protein